MNAEGKSLEIHFRIVVGDRDLPPHADAESPLETADIERLFAFHRPYLLRHGRMEVQGLLAISVDSEPWNGGYDAYGPDHPKVLYFSSREFYCEIDWLRGITDLLLGHRETELERYDDETPPSISRSRHQVLKIWLGEWNEPIHTPLLPFAKALVIEAEKLQRFSYRLLSQAYTVLSKPDLAPLELSGIECLVEEIRNWLVKTKLSTLQKAISSFDEKPSLLRVWNDVLDLIEEIEPAMRQEVLHESNKNCILVLQWDDLATEELRFLSAYAAHPHSSKKVVWQNPYQQRPSAHYYESLQFVGDGATLRLRTTMSKTKQS